MGKASARQGGLKASAVPRRFPNRAGHGEPVVTDLR